jgi:hypothetical protein
MIHVHGGSHLLENIARAGIPGERLEWKEVLCQGPTPAGLAGDAWYALRASFLAGIAESPVDEIAASLAAQDAELLRATGHGEIVLWFGPELFCQAILVRLLAHFSRVDLGRTRLSLISIDRYPGLDDQRSCTVSQLSGDQLTDVFSRRPLVTTAQLAEARRAWDAMGAATPEPLAAFVRDGNGSLPFLRPALRRLLAELPDIRSGLGRTEQLILDALAHGSRKVGDVFVAANQPEPRKWITDTILIDQLRRMAEPKPLVEIKTNGGGMMGAEVRRTTTAEEVMAGRDAIGLRGIDRWVGGTHLTTSSVWRWDDATSQVRRS